MYVIILYFWFFDITVSLFSITINSIIIFPTIKYVVKLTNNIFRTLRIENSIRYCGRNLKIHGIAKCLEKVCKDSLYFFFLNRIPYPHTLHELIKIEYHSLCTLVATPHQNDLLPTRILSWKKNMIHKSYPTTSHVTISICISTTLLDFTISERAWLSRKACFTGRMTKKGQLNATHEVTKYRHNLSHSCGLVFLSNNYPKWRA